MARPRNIDLKPSAFKLLTLFRNLAQMKIPKSICTGKAHLLM